MKITVFFLGRIGAGPKYTFEMVKAIALLPQEISIQIVIPDNIDNINDWFVFQNEFSNIKLHFVKTYFNKWSFLKAILNFKNHKNIANLIKEFNPDAIYLPMGGLLHPFIFRYLKSYFIINTLHDPKLHLGEESFFVEILRRLEIKRSNKLVLLNSFYVDQVIRDFKKKKEDIIVIPHASFFVKKESSLSDSFVYRILFVGRIERYKGVDLLLNAMDNVIEKFKDIQCTIAGSGNIQPYMQKIEMLGNNVSILNKWLSDDEIENLIATHDFLVLPYLDASQSGVIPLAYGSEKTVVATNVGALSEQVPLDIGFLVNPDSNELSNAIIKIYEEGIESLNQRNKKAQDYAINHLSWESSAKKIVSFLIK